jgi:hypothetical protein
MTVVELAEELGIETGYVAELLDKQGGDAVTDVDKEVVQQTVLDGSAPKARKRRKKAEAPANASEVVVYLSLVRRHSFPVDGRLVSFKDFRLAALRGGKVDKALRQIKPPEVFELIDEPFTSTRQAAELRKLLDTRLYTGHNREPSMVSGLTFLMSFFHQHDLDEVAEVRADADGSLDAVIELAVRKKSLRSLLEE